MSVGNQSPRWYKVQLFHIQAVESSAGQTFTVRSVNIQFVHTAQERT